MQHRRLTPHTLPHTLHSFLIPLPYMPFKYVSSRMVVRGRWGSEGIRCHFERKKGRKKEIGWKLYITLFSLNCTIVKAVWPLSALPAVERPFLSSPESYFNGTLLSALFLRNWFLLHVVLDEYFHGFLCSSWILCPHLNVVFPREFCIFYSVTQSPVIFHYSSIIKTRIRFKISHMDKFMPARTHTAGGD